MYKYGRNAFILKRGVKIYTCIPVSYKNRD